MGERVGPDHRVPRSARERPRGSAAHSHAGREAGLGRRLRALGLAAALAAFPGASETRAAPRVLLDPIALSTDQIPGWYSGARFGGFADAIVNEAGDVAFLAAATGSPAVGRGWGIWLYHPTGRIVEVARYSDPAPGVPSSAMGLFLLPALGDSGAIAFVNGNSQGEGLGLWRWREGNAPTLLATAGAAVPESAQGAFTSLKAPPALNARDEVAFAAFTNFGARNEGIWGPDAGGGLRLLARKGDPSPGGWLYRFDFVEGGIAPPSLNDAGETAFALTMKRIAIGYYPIAHYVFGPNAAGNLTYRVGTDARLPVDVLGAGFTFASPLRGIGFHARGEIAFTAAFAGPDGDSGTGIWLSERAGRIVPIALGRDPAAGFVDGWYYDLVRDPVLGPAGHVGFRGTLRSLGSERGAATWRWDAATGAVPLAIAGDPAPGFPAGATLTDPSIVALNAQGDALFEDGVSTQGGAGPSVRTLFYAPARGSSFPVLREGDTLEVAAGQWRSVRRWLWSSQASGRRVLNDAGDIPLRVEFADGSSGVFVARVFARVDRDGDGVRDLEDVCAEAADPEQRDSDANGVGDACNDDEDADGDEFADDLDGCPGRADDQSDSDGDGAGDACDPFPNEADHEVGQLRADLALAQETTAAVLAEVDRLSAAQGGARGEIARCLERRFLLDADGDGEDASTDRCPSTSPSSPVDADGCSLDQFCAGVPPSPALCNASDWLDDEPLGNPRDCRVMGMGCRAR
jgi:hypothetical protein